jgi:hypothetical protein
MTSRVNYLKCVDIFGCSSVSFLTVDSLRHFLSNEMMYSCAIWADEEGGVLGDTRSDLKFSDLETAQL